MKEIITIKVVKDLDDEEIRIIKNLSEEETHELLNEHREHSIEIMVNEVDGVKENDVSAEVYFED